MRLSGEPGVQAWAASCLIGRVAVGVDEFGELGAGGGALGRAGEVGEFHGVGVDVEQHGAVGGVGAGLGVAPLFGADGGAVDGFAVLARDPASGLGPNSCRVDRSASGRGGYSRLTFPGGQPAMLASPIAFPFVPFYARCMELLTQDELVRLTPPERLALISQLWDSLEDEQLPLTTAQRAELDQRLASLDLDRSEGVTWAALKTELEQRCP